MINQAMILGTGLAVPSRILTNDDLARIVDTSDEWITTRTGIKTRYKAVAGEETSRLAASAGRNAVLDAGLEIDDIDMIVVATVTADMIMPSCACLVQKHLGAKKSFAFDINAACSGFLYAFSVAEKYIRADPALKVLVIGAETMSSRVNWQDRNTCVIFGDGAGAVVLGNGRDGRGILAEKLYSDGELYELLYVENAQSMNEELQKTDYNGSYIRMAGREVFKHAVRAMAQAVDAVLARAGVLPEELKLVIPHQANIRIIKKLQTSLKLPSEKVYVNVDKYGNTSAATIPIALAEASRSGCLQAGDFVLLCAFGGGFTWGAQLVRW
jgi:3-oxoacyl-[acyl-carrier-protein] synthase-3